MFFYLFGYDLRLPFPVPSLSAAFSDLYRESRGKAAAGVEKKAPFSFFAREGGNGEGAHGAAYPHGGRSLERPESCRDRAIQEARRGQRQP